MNQPLVPEHETPTIGAHALPVSPHDAAIETPASKGRWQTFLEAHAVWNTLLFTAWLAVALVLVAHHEPWRDEADAWLMARDATPWQVLKIAGHSGTPFVWYFLQMPFAKFDLDFGVQSLVHLAVAASAAWLLAFRSPFPTLAKAGLLSSYFLAFEYVAVARNYACGVALAFLAAHLFPKRAARPVGFGVTLFLLANTSVHFFFLAAGFAAVLAWDAWRGSNRRSALAALALVSFGLAACLAQAYPRAGGQMPDGLAHMFSPASLRRGIREAAFPLQPNGWRKVLAFALFIGIGAGIWRQRHAFMFYLISFVGLSFIFMCKYPGSLRHHGAYVIAAAVALWIAFREREREPKTRLRDPVAWGCMGLALCQISCLPSLVEELRKEVAFEFSEAKRMGAFLEVSGLSTRTIVAHDAPHTSAVLAQLRNVRSFYYPSIGAYGSHMLWDATYFAKLGLPFDALVPETGAAFPQWRDRRGRAVLILLRSPWPQAQARGFALVRATPGRAWWALDERMFLYALESDAEAVAWGRAGMPRY